MSEAKPNADGSFGCANLCKTEGLHQKGTLEESSFKDCGAEGLEEDKAEDKEVEKGEGEDKKDDKK